jgi:hypothetical protein
VALVQQSVRGAIEANVQTGGTLFEIDHLVVLVWGESQRDIEMATQILEQASAHVVPDGTHPRSCADHTRSGPESDIRDKEASGKLAPYVSPFIGVPVGQICLAYKPTGGRIVAVLSSRPKLAMEALFNTTIPPPKRYGSRLLFRQVKDPTWSSSASILLSQRHHDRLCAGGAHPCCAPCFAAGVAAAAGEPGQGRRAVGRHHCGRRRLLQVPPLLSSAAPMGLDDGMQAMGTCTWEGAVVQLP